MIFIRLKKLLERCARTSRRMEQDGCLVKSPTRDRLASPRRDSSPPRCKLDKQTIDETRECLPEAWSTLALVRDYKLALHFELATKVYVRRHAHDHAAYDELGGLFG